MGMYSTNVLLSRGSKAQEVAMLHGVSCCWRALWSEEMHHLHSYTYTTTTV